MNMNLLTIGSFTVNVIEDWIELLNIDGKSLCWIDQDGYEIWSEYEDGNLIHGKTSSGYEEWFTYDNNNCIYYKNSQGYEAHYDSNGNNIFDDEYDKV